MERLRACERRLEKPSEGSGPSHSPYEMTQARGQPYFHPKRQSVEERIVDALPTVPHNF